MDSLFQEKTDNVYASIGQLLPVRIKQKDLLDDSQPSHTEACDDEIPSEILPERPRIKFVELDASQMHHRRPTTHPMTWTPTGKIFQQDPKEQSGVKKNQITKIKLEDFSNQTNDVKEYGMNFANASTQDLNLMLHQNMVEISELSQLCVQMSEELNRRNYKNS